MSNTVRATISSLWRLSLQVCARRIAENRGHAPATPRTALRKLFLQERRDWSQPGAPHVGWKRGELAEVAAALVGCGDLAEEWGDVGYYVAHTWGWLWRLYYAVTPDRVVADAIRKFANRADESAHGGTLCVPVVYVDGKREVMDD